MPPMGLAIKTFYLSALFLAVQCAHQTEKTPADPWTTRTGVPPKRLVYIAVDGLTPAALGQGSFALLKSRGAVLPKTELGLLYSVPAVDLHVAQTGSLPKSLSFADQVFRDTPGRMGPAGALYPVNTFNKGQWTRLIGTKTGGILNSLRARGGNTYVIASQPELGFPWGMPGAGHFRFPRHSNPHWPREELFRVLETDPNWTGVFALIPADDANGVLEKLLPFLESKQLQSETLIMVVGTKTVSPRYLIGETQDTNILKFESKHFAAGVYDSVIRLWLKSPDRLKVAEVATQAEKTPLAGDIYSKERTGRSVHYIRTYRNPDLPEALKTWAETKHQGLVEAMANPSSADLIIVLQQGIAPNEFPLLIWAPHLKREAQPSDLPIRLVDLHAVAARLMGLPPPLDEEGHATPIDPYLQD